MEETVRKLIPLFCIITILLISPQMVLGADALYRMLHADEVESFKQDQDAFIVGELTGKQEGSYNVKVLKVISGKVSSNTIQVADDFTYGWNKELPAVSDFAVFSLKKQSENLYKKAWGIFKADSGNYNTLKLKPTNAPSQGLLADLACIQWYVNSGGKENDFSFQESTAYVRHSNGQVEQIFPVSTEVNKVISTSSNGIKTKEDLNVQSVDKPKINRIFLVVAPVFLMLIISSIFKKKKL